MSIDYDRLRQLVAEMEQGTAATTRYTWLDLARELLRLRDGVEKALEGLMHADGLLEDYGYGTPGQDLAKLLEGGTK